MTFHFLLCPSFCVLPLSPAGTQQSCSAAVLDWKGNDVLYGWALQLSPSLMHRKNNKKQNKNPNQTKTPKQTNKKPHEKQYSRPLML